MRKMVDKDNSRQDEDGEVLELQCDEPALHYVEHAACGREGTAEQTVGTLPNSHELRDAQMGETHGGRDTWRERPIEGETHRGGDMQRKRHTAGEMWGKRDAWREFRDSARALLVEAYKMCPRLMKLLK